MTRTAYIDHIQVVLLDDPIEMNVNKVEAGGGSPVTEQSGFYVFKRERLLQERVVIEIDLTDRQIVSGPPICVYLV